MGDAILEIKRKASLRVVASDHVSEVVTAPAERWQHGQDATTHDDLRTAERVSSGVTRLRAAGDIGDAEVIAAHRWWQDYAEGVEGARDPERSGSGGASDQHVTMLVRAQAIGRHRAVTEILGDGMTVRLVAFLVDELSFAALADRFMPGRADGRKRMATQMATLLTMLAGLYASIDRRRKNTS